MTLSRDHYEFGARVVTVRKSAEFFHKGEVGTVIESARDGNYRVRFDDGSAWWLHEEEFKRLPARRRRCSIFECIATQWAFLMRRSA